jgi:hypothetical protein
VAQVVAHLVWDQRVAGSSPVFPTMELLILFSYLLPVYGIGMVLVNEKLKEKK